MHRAKAGRPLFRIIDAVSHVLFRIIHCIMALAPIGAFGAMAFTIGKHGVGSLVSRGAMMLCFYATCALFIVVILGIIARAHGFSIWRCLKYIREELVIVLGTSSPESVRKDHNTRQVVLGGSGTTSITAKLEIGLTGMDHRLECSPQQPNLTNVQGDPDEKQRCRAVYHPRGSWKRLFVLLILRSVLFARFMPNILSYSQPHIMPKKLLTLFHDIEQNIDVPANPDTCLEATRGMLALEKEFGVSCTYNVVGRLMGQQPDLVRLIRDAGHEIAFHSFRHEPDWGPQRFLENVRACRNADSGIKGYRSPRSQWNDDVLTELWRLGFLWSAESDTSPQPYFIHKGLVRLPIAIDDWGLHTGKLSEVDWLRRVQHHHAQRTCFGVGTHDCVFAQDPDRYLALYRRLLCWIRDQGIETATFGEVADLYRRSAIADYYDRRFPSWNSGVGALYRTGRFKDLITAKIQELHSPVVADLGSAGGALSRHLDSAATVYCVDMVPGMIKDIAAGNVRAVVGDVTASTLADNSIDFVIAARVIEYLYEPELLLDEIRRISRKDAGFFFSFPALTAKPPSNEGCAPDRVRRHYSKEEVESLGRRLGPGRVYGVHYLGGQEPRSPDEKQRLLDLEARQPEDMQPLDWVYIGQVESKTPTHLSHRTIELTDFAFEIPRDRLGIAGWMKHLLARVRPRLAG